VSLETVKKVLQFIKTNKIPCQIATTGQLIYVYTSNINDIIEIKEDYFIVNNNPEKGQVCIMPLSCIAKIMMKKDRLSNKAGA
jgi:hypothetical protein